MEYLVEKAEKALAFLQKNASKRLYESSEVHDLLIAVKAWRSQQERIRSRFKRTVYRITEERAVKGYCDGQSRPVLLLEGDVLDIDSWSTGYVWCRMRDISKTLIKLRLSEEGQWFEQSSEEVQNPQRSKAENGDDANEN